MNGPCSCWWDPCDVSQVLCVFVMSWWWDERMDTIMK